MAGTPVDRIALDISPIPGLARVVRTAVRIQGRAIGLNAAGAAAVAAKAANAFRRLAGREKPAHRGPMRLLLEAAAGHLVVVIVDREGGARRLFRARAMRRTRRKAGPPGGRARSTARR